MKRHNKGAIGIALSVLAMGLLIVIVLAVHVVPPCEEPAPADETVRYMGIPVIGYCDHLYNNGNHREWAACMGVGYNE